MGTNYYVENEDMEQLHIGKQSYGWEFYFKGWKYYDYFGEITSWEDWKRIILELGQVVNEYGEIITANDFIDIVEKSRDLLGNPKIPPINFYDYYIIKFGNESGTEWKDENSWSFTSVYFS